MEMSAPRLVSVVSFAVLALGWQVRASEVTARLKTGVLPSPGATLSKSDFTSESSRPVRLDKRGLIVPKKGADLKKKLSFTMTLAGDTYSMLREGGRFSLQAPGGGSAKLTRRGAGFQPVPIALPNSQMYALAFPQVGAYDFTYRSGVTRRVKVGRDLLALYDDNTDGFYTTDDTFQVGRSLVFAPISGYFATSSAVFKLGEIDRDGSQVTYSPYTGGTGELSLESSARSFAAHVALGSKGADLNLVLTSSQRSVKVIPGSYQLLYGLAYGPTKRKAYAGIACGSFAPVEVSEGGSAKVKIGAPFHLDFTHGVQGNKLTLSPTAIRLMGRGGEEYVSFTFQGLPQIKIISGGVTKSTGSMSYG
jgi:hypothetical protein